MIVLISPTKTMKEVKGTAVEKPFFLKVSKKIMKELKSWEKDHLMTSMKINETLADINLKRYHHFLFDENGTAAILAYKGLQYQQIEVESFTTRQKEYAQEHVRILSGLYGCLKPFDSIYPYRLEMQCNIEVEGNKDLYALWEKRIERIGNKEELIVNLASKEYTKVLSTKLQKKMITITFLVEKLGVCKVEATASKMARGRMIRYLVVNEVKDVNHIKLFCENDFVYREDLSKKDEFVFVKKVRM